MRLIRLTLHEHKLIILRLEGREYKELAWAFDISVNTVRNNFQYIYGKLGKAGWGRISCLDQLRSIYGKYLYESNMDVGEINLEKERENLKKWEA